jgi:endonuclease/exonuclease/phosphatase family metal-dependent hydrolase
MLIVPPLAACDPTALAPRTVRVVTWNLHAGLSSSIDDVAALLAGLAPDVALLQEVDFGVRRSGRVDQPDRLAAALGGRVAFAEALPWDGGHYGLAVVSRLPFAAVARHAIDAPGESEPRIALDVTVCAGPTALRIVDVHADNIPAPAAANARALVDLLATAIGSGLIVGGDFNALPADPGPRAFVAAGFVDLAATRDPSPTWPEGGRREDYVFADARLAPAVTALRVVDTDRSDHRPIVVDFAF